jgi:DNA-binding transcriptional regulator YiaG
MYSRHETIAGRFIYVKKKNLENLWNGYSKARQRLYGKLKSFGGSFPDLMERYFDEMGIMIDNKPATFVDYEKAKDRAIFSIGVEVGKKENKELIKLRALQSKIASLTGANGITQQELARRLGTNARTIRDWSKISLNPDFSLGKEGFGEEESSDSINNVVVGRKNPSDDQPEDQDSPNNSSPELENDDFDDEFSDD